MPSSFIYKKPPLKIILLYTDSLKLPFACGKWAVRGCRRTATKPPVLRVFHPSLRLQQVAWCLQPWTSPSYLAKSQGTPWSLGQPEFRKLQHLLVLGQMLPTQWILSDTIQICWSLYWGCDTCVYLDKDKHWGDFQRQGQFKTQAPSE